MTRDSKDTITTRIGPLVLGFRRRREPVKEWAELDAAVKRLVVTMRATSEAHWVERAMAWLGLGR